MAVLRERNLYEVLGLSCDCTPEEIRSAFKKLALQFHPDKLLHTGISEEVATAQFQELLHAYEVLSDPDERSFYDYERSQAPPKTSSVPRGKKTSSVPKAKTPRSVPKCSPSTTSFTIDELSTFLSESAFSGYSDTGKGFYKVYSDLFGKLYSAEVNFARKTGQRVQGAPMLGNLESSDTHVTAFYNYWLGFGEKMASVSQARREYYEIVRGLVEFVMMRDKRFIYMEVMRNLEKEMDTELLEESEKSKREVPEKKARFWGRKAELFWEHVDRNPNRGLSFTRLSRRVAVRFPLRF